jgi:anti-sigma B factor antagonist
MKTSVGVFSTRDRAEDALRVLLKSNVPPERITFLTLSEPDATSVAQYLQPQSAQFRAGTPARFSATSIPGIGPVLVQGPDVSDIFARPNSPAGTPSPSETPPTSSSHRSDDDASFFRRMLMEGCSVIVVRSNSSQIAAAACEVLDRLSLGIRKAPLVKSGLTLRQIPGAAIATFSGKLALDDGCRQLRETVHALLDGGQLRILLNLERLDFLDSAGLGELVRTHVAVRGRGGQLTLINPAPNVRQLLRITKVDQVFDIAPDEFTAINRPPKANAP